MKIEHIKNLKYTLIGFTQYSILEFDQYRILIDQNYGLKFKEYINQWGIDSDACFNKTIDNCISLLSGNQVKNNDLPIRFCESIKLGTTTNLLNGLKIQFVEDTLFGKMWKSKIHTINFNDEKLIKFFY